MNNFRGRDLPTCHLPHPREREHPEGNQGRSSELLLQGVWSFHWRN